jgi:hypothetical protein
MKSVRFQITIHESVMPELFQCFENIKGRERSLLMTKLAETGRQAQATTPKSLRVDRPGNAMRDGVDQSDISAMVDDLQAFI